MKLEIAREARLEATDAGRRYAREDRRLAARFRDELAEAFERIEQGPLRWPLYLHDTRRVLLNRFPFQVVYQVLPDRVVVLAIAHQHRKPGYWADRTRT